MVAHLKSLLERIGPTIWTHSRNGCVEFTIRAQLNSIKFDQLNIEYSIVYCSESRRDLVNVACCCIHYYDFDDDEQVESFFFLDTFLFIQIYLHQKKETITHIVYKSICKLHSSESINEFMCALEFDTNSVRTHRLFIDVVASHFANDTEYA